MRTRIQALALTLLLALPLSAQAFGEITGTVTDPTGGVAIGAAITVRNVATNSPLCCREACWERWSGMPRSGIRIQGERNSRDGRRQT